MRAIVTCALLLFASTASAAGGRRHEAVFTVKIGTAELRGRPSLDSAVIGLVRRGETVALVRTSPDRRWTEVDVGAGELAWMEARALKAGAPPPEPERFEPPRARRLMRARAAAPPEPPRRTRVEPREEPAPPPRAKLQPREEAPPPRPKPAPPVQVAAASRPSAPQRELRPAKAGEVFAADLDDEKPPTGPRDNARR